jgi:hypothetical protein
MRGAPGWFRCRRGGGLNANEIPQSRLVGHKRCESIVPVRRCSCRPKNNIPLKMSSPSSSSTSTSRLNNIFSHIMGSASSPWAFTADVVPQAPEDPLFGLMAAYRRDTSPKKVDLGIGAYRDNNAKPWVLPVVKKVSLAIIQLNCL